MENRIKHLQSDIVPILRNHNVLKAGLFGSYARGDINQDSDVDILIELPQDVSLFEFSSIKIELEERLQKKVDLVEYSSLKQRLKKNILNDHIAIL